MTTRKNRKTRESFQERLAEGGETEAAILERTGRKILGTHPGPPCKHERLQTNNGYQIFCRDCRLATWCCTDHNIAGGCGGKCSLPQGQDWRVPVTAAPQPHPGEHVHPYCPTCLCGATAEVIPEPPAPATASIRDKAIDAPTVDIGNGKTRPMTPDDSWERIARLEREVFGHALEFGRTK